MKPTSVHLPQIFVRNLQRRMAVDRNALESFTERAWQLCKALPRNRTSALSSLRKIYVIVVSDRKISDLHRRFMQISGPTDVITFEHVNCSSAPKPRAVRRRFSGQRSSASCAFTSSMACCISMGSTTRRRQARGK